jgi:hypothetical protein
VAVVFGSNFGGGDNRNIVVRVSGQPITRTSTHGLDEHSVRGDIGNSYHRN